MPREEPTGNGLAVPLWQAVKEPSAPCGGLLHDFACPGWAIYPIPHRPMLWTYKLNFTGFLEAPSDLAAARRTLAEKMKADPYAFISSLTPAEPSCKTVFDVFKKAIGG